MHICSYIKFPMLASQTPSENMPFQSFIGDFTVLQYRYYHFRTPHKVDGEGVFSQLSTLKTVPLDKKKNQIAAHAKKGVEHL